MLAEKAHKRAVFAGCARNCARYLGYTLENVSQIARLFSDSAFVFVENDSSDLTKPLLQSWCASARDARLVCLDGLGAAHPERTLRLEIARNEYLRIVRNEFGDFDYLFVIDCDDAGAQSINSASVFRALHFLEQHQSAAAVFGNPQGVYYDLWALRDRDHCPKDIWEEVCDFALASGVSDEEAYRRIFAPRIFSLNSMQEPLEVDSAFGGFGIYKIPSVVRNQKSYVGSKKKLVPGALIGGAPPDRAVEAGWQMCEHVAFNQGFRENDEKLFILPYLTNCTSADIAHAKFPHSAWREMLFDISPGRHAIRPEPKIETGVAVLAQNAPGRNSPCPCGSGEKYKHCCGRLV